jgi:hypothetical protein
VKPRTKKYLKRGAVALIAVAAIVGLGVANANAAPVPDGASRSVSAVTYIPTTKGAVTNYNIKDGTIYCADLAPGMCEWFTGGPFNGTVHEATLDAALRAKVNAVGAPGAPGQDALLTISADSMVTGRDDTATDASVWAKDSMTRTLTVVRQHADAASKCGPGAVKCWFYTGTIKDNGTFTTVAGAHGPNSTTPINGVVNGTVNGVYEIEFYANSDVPNSTHVDSTVSGNSPTTSNWMKLAFPAGTQFDGFTGVDYKWVYTAPATCEVHQQSTAGNTGDILGVNAC